MKVYEMEMEFEVAVGLKDFNDIMNRCGMDGRVGVTGYALTVTQTVPFIPDEAYLEIVASVIKEKYQTDNLEILECKFKGYKKFLEKEVEIDGEDE